MHCVTPHIRYRSCFHFTLRRSKGTVSADLFLHVVYKLEFYITTLWSNLQYKTVLVYNSGKSQLPRTLHYSKITTFSFYWVTVEIGQGVQGCQMIGLLSKTTNKWNVLQNNATPIYLQWNKSTIPLILQLTHGQWHGEHWFQHSCEDLYLHANLVRPKCNYIFDNINSELSILENADRQPGYDENAAFHIVRSKNTGQNKPFLFLFLPDVLCSAAAVWERTVSEWSYWCETTLHV